MQKLHAVITEIARLVSNKAARNILLISSFIAIVFPLLNTLFVYPLFAQVLIDFTEEEAAHFTSHMLSSAGLERLDLEKDLIPNHFLSDLEILTNSGEAAKVRIFSGSGEIVYSSDPEEIGTINESEYFHHIVAEGHTYAKVARKETQSLEEQPVSGDVVETYVPIMRDDTFVGAFELYYDITARQERLDRLTARTSIITFVVGFGLLAVVTTVSFKMMRAEEALRTNEAKLKQSNRDLRESNQQLLALQAVSATITSSLDLQYLLNTVGREMANLSGVRGCAISEWNRADDTLILISEYGPEEWLDEEPPQIYRLEDYALTKRVLVERCAQQMTISQPDIDPAELAFMQGENITSMLMLPMVYQDRVVGLVEIKDDVERTFTEQEIALAQLLANQAASAIENARLYEQAQQEIDERKRAEEALAQQAQELGRSNAELQRFANIASHDLQEPLRKITTFGDRLQAKYSDALAERGCDYLARMQNAAVRMRALIEGLLAYSRVTTQAQPFEPVDLTQVARGVLSDLDMRIEEIGGRVEVYDLPIIEADRLQMRQLFQNLIGNALKFHREDEAPLVSVQTRHLRGQGDDSAGSATGVDLCQITVTDNGIGFEEKYLDRIFQVFQRLHGRGAYERTGIGLATCRKIVERHGGSITAESKPGQGATFMVTLPLKQSTGDNSYG